MKKIFQHLSQEEQKKLKEKDQPRWTQPMLATLTDDYFSDRNWIFERKLDGERCLAFRDGTDVRILSRNRKDLSTHYPELPEALSGQKPKHFILDGEVVTFKGNLTSFAKLQDRMHVEDPKEAKQTGIPIFYYVFDILYLEGYDTTDLPLRTRKSLLKRAFSFPDPIRFLNHRNTEGEAYLKDACGKGWEGIIAKDAHAEYVHGRSTQWLKFKCVNQQEFVIGGFTDPHGERIGFGALLVGYYEKDSLVYAGKVGTGYDEKTLNRLYNRLSSLERKTSPFDTEADEKEVHWVSPKLVAEIGFTEWTPDDRLRHPRFLGLRRDKNPEEVVREEPGT